MAGVMVTPPVQRLEIHVSVALTPVPQLCAGGLGVALCPSLQPVLVLVSVLPSAGSPAPRRVQV